MLNNKFSKGGCLVFRQYGLPALCIAGSLLLGGCSFTPKVDPAPDTEIVGQAVNSPLRTQEDRALDASRRPAQFLTFARVKLGMQVLDVAAGAGTSTRLLALAVGPQGTVYSQSPVARPLFEKQLSEAPQKNIVSVVRPFNDPLTLEIRDLDLIVINLSYHDIANIPVDRISMNRFLYQRLKKGGHLIVIDHAAMVGAGLSQTKTLHRIEEASVRSEMEEAGFVLEESSTYLRNSADQHEKKSIEMERMTDKFALRFVKP